MVRFRRYAADHDGSPRKVAEPVARDLDTRGAQPNTARIGIRVVADPERHLPQVGELVMSEYDAACRGDLYRGRLLARKPRMGVPLSVRRLRGTEASDSSPGLNRAFPSFVSSRRL